jgi:hypothetical protein
VFAFYSNLRRAVTTGLFVAAEDSVPPLLSSPATGFVRDSLIVPLVVFTDDGLNFDEQEERAGKLRTERDLRD